MVAPANNIAGAFYFRRLYLIITFNKIQGKGFLKMSILTDQLFISPIMKPVILFLIASLMLTFHVEAQIPAANDFLKPAFHKGRRDAFRNMMPAHSVAVIFSAPVKNFANDVDYVFHQNPDLYYLTGYNEPHSVLLLFKEVQTNAQGKSYNELFFVQKRDPEQESWTGKRLGVEGVQRNLGIEMVFENSAFNEYKLDFSTFENIIYDAPRTDVGNYINDESDLYDLMKQFRTKAAIKDDYDPMIFMNYGIISQYGSLAPDKVKSYLAERMKTNKNLNEDKLIKAFVNAADTAELKKAIADVNNVKNPPRDFEKITNSLREIKTPEEMVLLQKAIDISSVAHAETMKAIRPGISERELQGIQEFVHKKYGSEEVGYPSIVGTGKNGCILHYESNSDLHSANQLVLMDVGAEYHGYTADITRTFPATGKFSKEQLLLYNLVYDAQEAVFKICKEGTPFGDLQTTSAAVLAKGLKSLGIIADEKDVSLYYPHGVSHHLGLDVHDKSNYGDLKDGMVITVEPGIYIPEGSKCDKKWWGIGIRIEDDVLVEKDKGKILSTLVPRKASEIEKLIEQKSPLENFLLPPLSAPKKGF